MPVMMVGFRVYRVGKLDPNSPYMLRTIFLCPSHYGALKWGDCVYTLLTLLKPKI